MTTAKRAGYDLISSYDRESGRVCFTDGTIERPGRGRRLDELGIAASHPAIRDVWIGSPVTATTCASLSVVQDCALDEVIAAAKTVMDTFTPPGHIVRITCSNWL